MGGGRSQRRHNRAHSYPPFLLPPAAPPVAGSSTSASCSLPQGLGFTPRPQLQPALTPPRSFLETPHQKLSSREFSGGTLTVKDAVSNLGGELLIRSCKPHGEAKNKNKKTPFSWELCYKLGPQGHLGKRWKPWTPVTGRKGPGRSPRCYTQGTPDQHCWTPPENEHKAGGLQLWYWI